MITRKVRSSLFRGWAYYVAHERKHVLLPTGTIGLIATDLTSHPSATCYVRGQIVGEQDGDDDPFADGFAAELEGQGGAASRPRATGSRNARPTASTPRAASPASTTTTW
ncbi:hypothetical protein OG264_01600 [Streptomyces xanthophaeus]|uniref:hypothetical protein n=1 Tax=Streptomyces xanthophaeus TaxID=67385 RepID=UPI00386D6573|nr:hypothetical protein OG264_01600 [Streptomyces xanthophaeus]WST64716.1 hypothetical protein OG605_36760 [Streptomyces xanthophaeus]